MRSQPVKAASWSWPDSSWLVCISANRPSQRLVSIAQQMVSLIVEMDDAARRS
jgi:hypothetical protein